MKRYVVRKYVMANNVAEAYRLEKQHEPEDIWLDDKQPELLQSQIGFNLENTGVSYSPILKKKKRK